MFYNVTATLEASAADMPAMPETYDAMNLTDSPSFGQFDADMLADASASFLAELNKQSGWLNAANLA